MSDSIVKSKTIKSHSGLISSDIKVQQAPSFKYCMQFLIKTYTDENIIKFNLEAEFRYNNSEAVLNTIMTRFRNVGFIYYEATPHLFNCVPIDNIEKLETVFLSCEEVK